MGSFVQTSLPTQITTPLGSNALLVRSYSGEEGISELFHYDLELYSESTSLDATQIVGKAVTLQIPLSNGSFQYVNGIVGRFTQAGMDNRFVTYLAEIHPWLWMLTMSADCRIFQNLSCLDIVKQVFSNLGFSDYSDKTTGTYTALEYCVQYRESAFAFVSRLLEEAGISYYFTHDVSKHTMVLVDDTSSWGTCPGLTSARYVGRGPGYNSDDIVVECGMEQSVTPNQFKTDDYNFTIPATQLLATASGSSANLSIYEFPGLYSTQSDGETMANLRLAALEAPAATLRGSSLCRSFHAGASFTLANHYSSSLNASYVIRRLTLRGTQDEYSNSFEAFPAATTFRPPLSTPHPIIAGTQTAVVVGKEGEEIWTDQYGRVVVQFQWDQLGKNNETSSCWVRVAQSWAGNLWGAIFIPRIGQEVVVSFLEGNPDRPLITGCVYNAAQVVPYTLPDNQTRSTIKSSSSKGGEGFNEICFEDKAGSEEIYIQAQKDMTVSILNNDSLTVAGRRTVTVTSNETHTSSANYTLSVAGDYTLSIGGNLKLDVGGSISITSATSITNTAGTSLTNKSGTDMTNNAGTTLTNQAAASQTVDGGGQLTVKGGVVQIN